MLVRKLKIDVEGEEIYVNVDKGFYWSSDIDYYIYYVTLYKKNIFLGVPIFYKIWKYHTYWLYYTRYRGNIDEVIKEGIDTYVKNRREQKYIGEKEVSYSNLKARS